MAVLWRGWLGLHRECIDREEINPRRTQAFNGRLEKENTDKKTRQNDQWGKEETGHRAVTEAWRRKYCKMKEVVNRRRLLKDQVTWRQKRAHTMKQHGRSWVVLMSDISGPGDAEWISATSPILTWQSRSLLSLLLPRSSLLWRRWCDALGKKAGG